MKQPFNIRDFSAILFDFDGVIAHTRPIAQQALWALFRAKSISIAEKEYEENGWWTKSLQQICQILEEKYGVYLDFETFRTEVGNIQIALYEEGVESDPTLFPFLEYCRQNKIRLAIGSNWGRARIEWLLQKMKIADFFSGGLVTANDITHHKPDPEVWLKCAEMLEVPITSCLVIEDGLPGLTGAKQCAATGIYYHRFCWPAVRGSEEPSGSRREKACEELAEKSVGSFSELLE